MLFRSGQGEYRDYPPSDAPQSKEFIDSDENPVSSPPPGFKKSKKRSSGVIEEDGEDDKPAKKRKSKEKSEPKKRKGKAELTGKDAEIAELRKVRESARLADF